MTRRGMTLVEMLVALTATLMLMGAIAQAFAVFGEAVGNSRSLLDLDARLRTTAGRLRSDLAGITVSPLPPIGSDTGEGYLEIIEGPNTDHVMWNYFDPSFGPSGDMQALGDAFSTLDGIPGPGASDDRLLGDCDDAILFTTRDDETPFIGRAPGPGAIESPIAELAWFARATPGTSNPVTYTLYRRQLLVMGYMGAGPFPASTGNSMLLPGDPSLGTTWAAYFDLPCDVSARAEGSSDERRLYPNTLADLTRRENRFRHVPGLAALAGFPFPFVQHQAASEAAGLIFTPTSPRFGEDVILTNVIAFDVRVFDPAAPVMVNGASTPLVPGDPGFTNVAAGSGAYVDLGNGQVGNSQLTGLSIGQRFAGLGELKSGLRAAAGVRRTYDTFTTHYESNGKNENGDQEPDGEDTNYNGLAGERRIDEGTNGLDDDRDNLFDEPPLDGDGDGVFEDTGEAETLPPYPSPLRGIEVRIRCYEPSSRQVRQVTVRHTFVPH